MLSRGHWIGESIDELATLASQVNIRGQLGLTDLHVFIENFFRDLLNVVLGWDLESANQDRHNFPGIDLMDKNRRLAIQVTATKTSEKINETLRVFCEKHISDYDRLIVLVVGSKQGTYTLDSTLQAKARFSIDDIWDMATLSHKIVDLNIDLLQQAHGLIKKSIVKVKVELEVPNEEGRFPTSASNYLEAVPQERIGDLSAFFAHQFSRSGTKISSDEEKEYRTTFLSMVSRLKRLPRISREFVAILLQERNRGSQEGWAEGEVTVSLARIERMMKGFSVQEEVDLLLDLKVVDVLLPDDYEGHFRTPQLRMLLGRKMEYFLLEVCDFIESTVGKSGFMKPFVQLDFGAF